MFDIGFIEVVLIAVVSLLVLGPDKLPGAIRTTGLWIGRLKRSFNNIKSDIEREVGADEIRRQLRNEAIMDKIKNTKGQFTESIQSVKKETQSVADSMNIKKDIESGLTGSDSKNKTPEQETAQVSSDSKTGTPAQGEATDTPPSSSVADKKDA